MLWRHLCLVRAWSAAGLLSWSMLGASSPTLAASEPETPAPSSLAASATVSILDAKTSGDLSLELRGAGADRVKMKLKNLSGKRLNVVLPAGLVASSLAGQGRPGGGGGGGFQNMGLGSVSNKSGGFGEFRTTASADEAGFRSVAVSENPGTTRGINVPAGETVEVTMSSVCMNFGLPTPNARDRFDLVSVDDFSTDVRVRKALKSLVTFGTSQGVAQAAMWNVCNAVPFALMAEKSAKTMNLREVALASRFVEALDLSNASELVDPNYLNEGRIFLRVVGDGSTAKDAARIIRELEGLRVLGLPVRVVETIEGSAEASNAPAMLVNVVLSPGKTGETKGKVGLSEVDLAGQWAPMGKTSFVEGSAPAVFSGAELVKALDRSIVAAFVTVKSAGHSAQATSLKVENRLPFTIAGLSIKTGDSSGAPTVSYRALGIAPARSGVIAIQAAGGKVEHVELNGL